MPTAERSAVLNMTDSGAIVVRMPPHSSKRDIPRIGPAAARPPRTPHLAC